MYEYAHTHSLAAKFSTLQGPLRDSSVAYFLFRTRRRLLGGFLADLSAGVSSKDRKGKTIIRKA